MKTHHKQTVKLHAPVIGITMRKAKTEPPAPTPQETPPPAPQENHVNDQALRGLLEDMNSQLADVLAARSQNIRELQEVAIELAMVIAAHIVKEKIESDQFDLTELIRSAIDQLVPAEQISIRVNPQDSVDLEALNEWEDLGGKVNVTQDAKVPRGGCLVQNEQEGLLTSVEGRLENIRDTLLQGIDYARVERRKIVGNGGSLRRFPDRRKLA